MGGVFRDHVQCALDYFGHLLIRDKAQTAGAKFVCETFDLVLHKTPPPFTHCLLMDTEACSNFLAGQFLGTEQDHPAAGRKRPRCSVPLDLTLKKLPLLLTQHHLIRNPA